MKKIVIALLFVCVTNIWGKVSLYASCSNEISNARVSILTTDDSSNHISKKGFDRSKLSLYTNFGLYFGRYSSSVNIGPQVGYDVAPNVTLGVGIGYSYYRRSYANESYKYSYLGGNVFGRFYPIRSLIIHAQPEINRVWTTFKHNKTTEKDSRFVPTMLVGVGYRMGGFMAMIQYDVIQDAYSPYGKSLFYSVGYGFNF